MMQQAYATALWYLSCIMPVSHTDKKSSEAVPGNESSTTTASFGKRKHARSLETAKDCSATVSNNRANGSVTVELSASGSVIAQRSASALVNAITESFSNKSQHARSSETAKDCLATVSKHSVNRLAIAACSVRDSVIAERSKDSARDSVIAQRSVSDAVSAITESSFSKTSVKSANKAIPARQSYASWKTTVYIVMVTAILTSLAIEVRGDLPGIQMRTAQTLVQPQSSGEISTQFSRCSSTRHSINAQ